jgi:hypothetical protein
VVGSAGQYFRADAVRCGEARKYPAERPRPGGGFLNGLHLGISGVSSTDCQRPGGGFLNLVLYDSRIKIDEYRIEGTAENHNSNRHYS